MRGKHLLLRSALLVPALAASVALTQCNKRGAKPLTYVQIFSVNTVPDELRAGGEPNTAALTVKVFSVREGSKLPPEATVRVEVGEYSSVPPGNEVSIEGSPQERRLDEAGKALFTFKVHTGPGTVSGTVTVQADIRGVSEGLTIRDPFDSMSGRATLRIRGPSPGQ